MTVEELEIVVRAKVGDAIKDIYKLKEEIKKVVNEVKEPMKQVAQQTREIAKTSLPAIRPAINGMREFKNQIKSTSAEQELLIRKINDLRATLELVDQDPKLFTESEVLDMRVELEKLENKLVDLQDQGSRTGKTIRDAFSSGAKTIRKFAWSLLSVRTIWAAISSAARSNLETDDKLRASAELTANVYGNILAPAIKFVTDMAQYAAIAVALLIKMFTGYDALAKVTTKNINKATKATKELNKELTSMDEITNISGKQSGAGGIDLTADFAALDEFNKKIKAVEEIFEKWNVPQIVDNTKKVLLSFWKEAKPILYWLWDHKEVIAGIFIGWKVTTWLNNIASLIGGGSLLTPVGLKGLLIVLGALAGAWVIKISMPTIQSWIDKAKELKAIMKSLPSDPSGLIGGGASSGGGSFGGGGGVGRFATGGVLYGPTYGLMAEYPGARSNPEIVTPQNVMRETMLDAFAQILPSLQRNNGGGGSGNVYLNGREVGEVIYDDLEKVGIRRGKPFTVRRA